MYIFDLFKRLANKKGIPVLIYMFGNLLLTGFLFYLLAGVFAKMPSFWICFLIGMGLYLVSLVVVMNPFGEWIIRFQNRVKNITKCDQADRMQALFNEVYYRAKNHYPELGDNIALYYYDDSSANAFAIGRKTIAVTEGLTYLSDNEIRAALAHEFGHIVRNDTDLIQLIVAGNMIISLAMMAFSIVIFIFDAIIFAVSIALGGRQGLFYRTFDRIFRLVATIFVSSIVRLWTRFGMFICRNIFREQEYQADAFAYSMGYGAALLELFGEGGLDCDLVDDSKKKPHGLAAALSVSTLTDEERVQNLLSLGAAINNTKRYCPNCNSELDSDAAFCVMCGTKLEVSNEQIKQAELVEQPKQVVMCPNCNKQLPDEAMFCPECGTLAQHVNIQVESTEPSQALAGSNQPTVTQQSVTTSKLKEKKPLSKTAKVVIAAVTGAIMLVAGIFLLLRLTRSINLNDYITVSFSGYNGYGTPVINYDFSRLSNDYRGKIEYDGKEVTSFANILSCTTYTSSKEDNLSNGDEIIITWTVDENKVDKFNYGLKVEDIVCTVSKLSPVMTINPFDNLSFSLEGAEPDGKIKVSNKDYPFIKYEVSKDDGLSNGDVIIISLPDDYDENTFGQESGIKLNRLTPIEYEINGLPSYVTNLDQISKNTRDEISMKVREINTKAASLDENILKSEGEIVEYRLLKKKDKEEQNQNKLYVVVKEDRVIKENDGRDSEITRFEYLQFELESIGGDGDSSINVDVFETSEEYYTYSELCESAFVSQSDEYDIDSELLVDIEYLENVNKSEEYIKVLINDIADNQMRVTQCIPVTLELQGDPCEGQKFEDSKGHTYEVKKVSDNPYVVKILENDFLKKLGKEHVSFPDYYLIVDDQDIVKGVDTFVFYAFGENTSGNNYKLVEYYQIWDAPDFDAEEFLVECSYAWYQDSEIMTFDFDENVDIYLMGEYGNSQYPEDENQIYIDFNLVGNEYRYTLEEMKKYYFRYATPGNDTPIGIAEIKLKNGKIIEFREIYFDV